MPRVSERQQILREIIDAMAVAILDEEAEDEFGDDDEQALEQLGDEEHTSATDEIAALLILVESHRYLQGHDRLPKSIDFRTAGFGARSSKEFRRMTRMDRYSFYCVVGEIEQHAVFYSTSDLGQAPVWVQLAVALDRLGNYGNGVSLGRTQKLWGIGHGTCVLYTTRVLIALKSLASKYVAWPDATGCRSISRRMGRTGFRGCVGFIDGTTIPLSQKPAVDGEYFFDRKQRYSVNAQVVCDDHRRIIAFYTGWPGSSADSTVYQEMQLSDDSKKPLFFSQGEYLIADSAYPADLSCCTVVPSYKSNMKGTDIEDFNTCVAHVRVVNEHTIGVLKGMWSSLRELRIQIRKKEDMERVLLWISYCGILHNMLIAFRDDWGDEDQSDSDSDSDREELVSDDEDNDNYAFRRELKRRVIAKGREPGGILWLRNRSRHVSN
jgi:hypothetical protein